MYTRSAGVGEGFYKRDGICKSCHSYCRYPSRVVCTEFLRVAGSQPLTRYPDTQPEWQKLSPVSLQLKNTLGNRASVVRCFSQLGYVAQAAKEGISY